MPNAICPVCKLTAKTAYAASDLQVKCPRCGSFRLTGVDTKTLSDLAPSNVAKLSGWIRENQDCLISELRLKELLLLRVPTVGEKGDKLLLFLAGRFPNPGTRFHISFISFTEYAPSGELTEHTDGHNELHAEEVLSACWAQDYLELRFLLEDYLTGESGLLSVDNQYHRITPKGWAHLALLRHGDIKSDRGFVAMWFDKSVDAADVTIGAAIREAGYRDLRIDRHDHNNRIDDEVIAAIRRSKFVVADFTGQRGGVYFEAGFALGLGIPVIWTCRKDDLTKIHFDNRQYNFLLWEADKLEELRAALHHRIEATIGAGPHKQFR